MSRSKPSATYLASLKKRYWAGSKKERSLILDEFVKTTGYHRKHAIALLRGKREHRKGPIRRVRRRRYLQEDRMAVLQIAEWFDQISSKRLRAAMDNTLDELYRRKHLRVSRECLVRLRVISASTMDRIRRPHAPHSARRSHTKPGTLLKRQIPIRMFAEWDDKRPGFCEVDLVDHSGGNARGEFAHTLNLTDVCSGWTEMRAVRSKAQTLVFEALGVLRGRLPVPLLGIDSDNGAEFINGQLLRYCKRERISFTRGRVGRKNDNPYIEQKNWSVVRRLVGYERYASQRQVDQLNRLYVVYRQYINFFLPVMKLKEKVRQGSRVRKIYDAPQTPYARLLASPDVSDADKDKLRATYAQLDVVQLKQQVDELFAQLKPARREAS